MTCEIQDGIFKVFMAMSYGFIFLSLLDQVLL